MLEALILSRLSKTTPDLPLETVLSQELRHVPLKSTRFLTHFKRVLVKYDSSYKWERHYGSKDYRMATLQSGWHEAAAIFWASGGGTKIQVVEESNGLDSDGPDINSGHLHDAGIIKGESFAAKNCVIHCGSASTGGNWINPGAVIYRLRKDIWSREDEIGDNSYDEGPYTHFARVNGRIDPTRIIATLGVYPPHLSQPHAGPHLRYDEVWSIAKDHFMPQSPRLLQTPVAELNLIGEYRQKGMRAMFDAHVPAQYRKTLWDAFKEPPDVFGNCKLTDSNYCPDLKVQFSYHFALEVKLRRSNGGWRVRSVKKVQA